VPTWVLQAISGARKVPWRRVIAAIAWLSTTGRKYWNRLSPDERREVRELAVKSKGKRANLSSAEQDRLVKLFQKIRREPLAE
jgi:TRAP-type C4-dicarboxylate transport system substrate-binding protein